MLTCLTDPLLQLPTRLLRCCRSCIKGALGIEFFFLLEAIHCLRQTLCVLCCWKKLASPWTFVSIRDSFWGKTVHLESPLFAHYFTEEEEISKSKKRWTKKKEIYRHYKYNMGTLQTVLPPLQPFIFDLPVHKPYYSMLNRWKAERWRGGKAAAQWWFCNWLLYLWLVHYYSSNAEVSGGVWCAVQISLPSTWYLCID